VIDLNAVPVDQEGTSASVRTLTVPITPSQPAPTMIDVDAIEDDVIESSASAFAEAKSKSRNARRRPLMVDVESGQFLSIVKRNFTLLVQCHVSSSRERQRV
jgi:hypothetical protein